MKFPYNREYTPEFPSVFNTSAGYSENRALVVGGPVENGSGGLIVQITSTSDKPLRTFREGTMTDILISEEDAIAVRDFLLKYYPLPVPEDVEDDVPDVTNGATDNIKFRIGDKVRYHGDTYTFGGLPDVSNDFCYLGWTAGDVEAHFEGCGWSLLTRARA